MLALVGGDKQKHIFNLGELSFCRTTNTPVDSRAPDPATLSGGLCVQARNREDLCDIKSPGGRGLPSLEETGRKGHFDAENAQGYLFSVGRLF